MKWWSGRIGEWKLHIAILQHAVDEARAEPLPTPARWLGRCIGSSGGGGPMDKWQSDIPVLESKWNNKLMIGAMKRGWINGYWRSKKRGARNRVYYELSGILLGKVEYILSILWLYLHALDELHSRVMVIGGLTDLLQIRLLSGYSDTRQLRLHVVQICQNLSIASSHLHLEIVQMNIQRNTDLICKICGH